MTLARLSSAFFVCALVVSSACSGSPSSPTPTPTPTPTPPPAPPAPPSTCSVTVPPNELTRTIGAAATEVVVGIAAEAGCTWAATSNAAFLTLPDTTAGTGSATLKIGATTNSGGERSGTVAIGNIAVTVTQAAAPPTTCAFTVAPMQIQVGPAGGAADIDVTATGTNCAWTASANDPFVSLTSGASGTNSGRVSLTVAANPGGARTAPVVVAGQTVTISQAAVPAPICTFDVTPRFPVVPYTGGTVTVNVAVVSGTNCAWTAALLYPLQTPGTTIVSGASGTGSGQVVVQQDQNPGTLRTAILVIAGQQVTIRQDTNPTGCVWALSPAALELSAAAQAAFVDATLTVGNHSYCQVQASGIGTWVRLVQFQPNGLTTRAFFDVQANPGAARSTYYTLTGNLLPISQTAAGAPGPTPTPQPCATLVTPASTAISSKAQLLTLAVNVPAGATGCNWTAVSNDSFLTVVSGASGTGAGTVTLAASENTSLSRRTGTVTIGGQTVYIGQNTTLFAAVTLTSAPGDIIGQGVTRQYTLQGANVEAVNNATTFGSMQITLRTADGTWRLRLEAPPGSTLAPGTYDNAGKPPTTPGLDFSRDATTCAQISGRFRLGDVVFSPNDTFYRVNIVFEQRCNGSSAALTGNIWISSDGTTTPPPLALPGQGTNIKR